MGKELNNEVVLLYKRLSRDIDDQSRSISVKKCNDYIEDLESLKDDIYDEGYEWIENFSDIEFIEEHNIFLGSATKDEIYETAEEVREQLDRLLGKLGIDITEKQSSQIQHSPNPITINFSPIMNQQVETSSNVNLNIQIEKLVKEFNAECEKVIPNKTRLNKILDKVRAIGPFAAPIAQKMIEKLAEFIF